MPLSLPAGPLEIEDYVSGGGASSSGSFLGGFPTLLKLGSTLLGAKGQRDIGREQAGAYEYNAKLAEQQGQIEEMQLGRQEVAFRSAQQAAYAKAGVELTGSPIDVMVDTASQFELDKQIAQYNAKSKAAMYRYQAAAAQQQGKFNMGSTLLSGALELAPLLFKL